MMEKRDNIFAAAVRMGRAFFVAGTVHVDPQKLADAAETMTGKTNRFIGTVRDEKSLARLMIAESIYRAAPYDCPRLPKTWDDFFKVINLGLERAEKKVEALNDPNETASFGRIKYSADLLQSWYQSQDTKVSKWLNSVVVISGSHSVLMALVPMDNESWKPLSDRGIAPSL